MTQEQRIVYNSMQILFGQTARSCLAEGFCDEEVMFALDDLRQVMTEAMHDEYKHVIEIAFQHIISLQGAN